MSYNIRNVTYLTMRRVRGIADPVSHLSCLWCGRHNAFGHLFAYGSETSRGFTWAKGLFCSIACYRAYHNID